MSREKPWSKHRFAAMSTRPLSCVVCSQPKEHENHEGIKNPKAGMVSVLARPDWRIYDAEPEQPVHGAIRSTRLNLRTEDPGHSNGDGPRRAIGQHGRDTRVQPRGARAASVNAQEGEARPELSPELPTPLPVAEIDCSQYEEFKTD